VLCAGAAVGGTHGEPEASRALSWRVVRQPTTPCSMRSRRCARTSCLSRPVGPAELLRLARDSRSLPDGAAPTVPVGYAYPMD